MKIIYNKNGTINFLATRRATNSKVFLDDLRKEIEDNKAFLENWEKRVAELLSRRVPIGSSDPANKTPAP